MAKPASQSPANVTITKHSMIASVLRDANRGRYVPPPLVIVTSPPPVPPKTKR